MYIPGTFRNGITSTSMNTIHYSFMKVLKNPRASDDSKI